MSESKMSQDIYHSPKSDPDSHAMNDSGGHAFVLPRIVLGIWLFFFVVPLFALLSQILLAIPNLVFFLIGAKTLQLGLLIIAGLSVLVLSVASLIGFVTGHYLSWVAANMAFHLASFLIGVAIIASLFNLPFDVFGFVILLGLFLLLKFSLLCTSSLNTRTVRDKYSVVKYSHY